MPYVIKYNKGSLNIFNRNYELLFSCKKRKTKSLTAFLKNIAGGVYEYDPLSGITSYLYSKGPLIINGDCTNELKDYLNSNSVLNNFF